MTREQIEKAWEEHTLCNPSMMDELSLNEKQAFVKGAQWRINAVWHNVNEKPNGMFVVLIDFGTEISPEEFGLGFTAEDLNGARRWAYVSDLLPERKEETNGGR